MATIKEVIREWNITQEGMIDITDDLLDNVNLEDILVAIEIMKKSKISLFNVQSKFCDNQCIYVPAFKYENIDNIIAFITVTRMYDIEIVYRCLVDLEEYDYFNRYEYSEEYVKQALKYCVEEEIPLGIIFILLNMIEPTQDEYETRDELLLDRYCKTSLKSAKNI